MKKKLLYIFICLILFPLNIYAKDSYTIIKDEYYIEVTDDTIHYNEVSNMSFSSQNIQVLRYLDSEENNFNINQNHIIDNDSYLKITSGNNSSDKYEATYDISKNNNDIYEIKMKNNYDTDMEKITFSINLPENVEKYNLNVYIDNQKITNSKDIVLNISDKSITGSYQGILKEGQTLTIKVDYSKIKIDGIFILSMTIPLIFTLISYLLWYFYGKDLKVKVVKTALLPKNLNPLDTALLCHEKVTIEDIPALLIYLSNKGYITIIEDKKHNITLVHNSLSNPHDYRETLSLKTIFKQNNSITLTDFVNILADKKEHMNPEMLEKVNGELLNINYKSATNKMVELSNNHEEKKKYFEKNAENLKNILLVFAALILVFITSIPFVEINKLYLIPISAIFSIIILFIIVNTLKELKIEKLTKKDFLIILAIIFIISLILTLPTYRRNRLYYLTYFLNISCVISILTLYKYMPKRNLYGNRLYKQVEGFELFIKECTNIELQRLLEVNPNYLYDVYSHALVLGLEKELVSKFSKLKVPAPSWYEFPDNFTITKFNNSMIRLKKYLLKITEKEQ